ncbi:histidine phosphatase family protein [bacterium]|nr:histidine phosphatase family protein [bacterium]
MKKTLKNRYFLLRHGKNIHQTVKSNILYCYPDDNPPCELIEEGIEQIEKAGFYLKNKEIDFIISSDILRTRQTSDIISNIIGYDKNKIRFDERLRDINWGIFGGKTIDEGWAFYKNDMKKRFYIAPEGGETWQDCRARVIEVLNELENEFNNKNILIISHGDPLWLLEGYILGISDDDLIDAEKKNRTIRTGEIKII